MVGRVEGIDGRMVGRIGRYLRGLDGRMVGGLEGI